MKRNIGKEFGLKGKRKADDKGYDVSPPPPKKRSYMLPMNTRVWVELSDLPLYEGRTDMYQRCRAKATITAYDGNNYVVKVDNWEVHNDAGFITADPTRVTPVGTAFPMIDAPDIRNGLPVIVHDKQDLWWDATIISDAPDRENAIEIEWDLDYAPHDQIQRVPLCFVRLRA